MQKIDICNMALAQLGEAPIESVKDQNERARKMDLFYDAARREVMRKHDWAFSRRAGKLARVTIPKEENPFPMSETYAYPADALYVVRVFVPCKSAERLPFNEFYSAALHKKCIASPLEHAHAEYVQDITDESLFTPDFCDMLALCLASKTAMTLTGDAQLAQLAYQKYMLALDEARIANKTEEWGRMPRKSAFVEVR